MDMHTYSHVLVLGLNFGRYTAMFGCTSFVYGGGADYSDTSKCNTDGVNAMVSLAVLVASPPPRSLLTHNHPMRVWCVAAAFQGLIFPTFYFIAFQVIASMMLINMFIGAILMSVDEAKEDLTNAESLTVRFLRVSNLRKFDCVSPLGSLVFAPHPRPTSRVNSH